MGMGEEFYDGLACIEDSFYDELEDRKERLSKKSDRDVLSIAIKLGPKLNEVTEFFPAYDVALKIQSNNWVPTEKQRRAIINVTAFYQTKKSFYEAL